MKGARWGGAEQRGDTLGRLGERFGQPVTVLQRLNPEVGDGRELREGQPLCVVPRVCPPAL